MRRGAPLAHPPRVLEAPATGRGRGPTGVVSHFALFLVALGCHRDTATPPAPSPSTEIRAASPSREAPAAGFKLAEAPPLPENPEQGRRAQAQWSEHLAREEEERQAAFDRSRLGAHRAILAELRAVAQRCWAPLNRRELETREQELARDVGKVDKKIAAVDPWGNSSRLLPAYATVRAHLARCPEAMRAALAGNPQELAETKDALTRGFAPIVTWLQEIAEDPEEKEAGERGRAAEGTKTRD